MVGKVLMEEMDLTVNQVKIEFWEREIPNYNYFNFSLGIDGVPGNIENLR